jgi:DNA-binding NarL/FixJ family response regulator
VRVVIAEDEPLLRDGLRVLLEREGLEVVAAAADGTDLLRRARAHRPDVVVSDLRMPPTYVAEGLEALLALRAERPGLSVLLLTQHVERRTAEALLATGPEGVGYLLKQRIANVATFTADLRRLAGGGTVLDSGIAETLVAQARRRAGALDRLTERQLEVLALVAQGRSNAFIAEHLGITEKSVVRHVSHVYAALGVPGGPEDHRRVQAVLRYLAAGGDVSAGARPATAPGAPAP